MHSHDRAAEGSASRAGGTVRRGGVGVIVALAFLTAPSAGHAVMAKMDGSIMKVTGDDGPDAFSLGLMRTSSGSWQHTAVSEDGRKISPGPGCRSVNPASEFGSSKDVVCSGAAKIDVQTGGGKDSVSPMVSFGRFVVASIRMEGGDGNDFLGASTEGAPAVLLGGPGKDYLQGNNFQDNPHAFKLTARGGGQVDVLMGSCKGEDALYGDGGADYIGAQDGLQDLVNGGKGKDEAATDKGRDVRKSIESSRKQDDCWGD